MGTLILINVLVTLQLFVGIGLGLLVAGLLPGKGLAPLIAIGIVAGVAVAPAFAGLFSYARAACDDDRPAVFADYFRGMRAYAVRSWILLAAQAATGGVLVLNLRFYGSLHTLTGQMLSVLILILIAVWAMGGAYAWPLLVRDMDWRLLFRNTFFLALAAPLSTLAMLLALGVVSALLVLTRVGVLIALFAIWAVTENMALRRLIRIFQARQEQPSQDQDSPSQ